jgi:uncharacterized protein YggU (UPF0235/DUF167 family)
MGEFRVRVRVKPGSRGMPSVAEGPDGVLVVTVRERAIEGAANAAVEAALAGHFGVAKRDVRIVAGATARIKTVAVATVGVATGES